MKPRNKTSMVNYFYIFLDLEQNLKEERAGGQNRSLHLTCNLPTLRICSFLKSADIYDFKIPE